MPFRSIVASPEELARIASAFEEAWGEVAQSVDPLSAPGQRERLAAVITELWSEDPTIDLKRRAVQRFQEIALKIAAPDAKAPQKSGG
ncbi:hypothetical protein [Bosea sp. BIWAKO-01]|uniref:hypothetical protein n=1 Tax=Bosea sp. BIWAKO-01 TaxID=506668 RepID=UPI0008538F01|nr:hypothetical protein [Bosea sp. BIWAKO-01]